jgi:long-chain acyl-CoA synthetase
MKITPTGSLTHQAQTRPQSVAFVFHEDVWTYERLAAEVERLACGWWRGASDRVIGSASI